MRVGPINVSRHKQEFETRGCLIKSIASSAKTQAVPMLWVGEQSIIRRQRYWCEPQHFSVEPYLSREIMHWVFKHLLKDNPILSQRNKLPRGRSMEYCPPTRFPELLRYPFDIVQAPHRRTSPTHNYA